MPAEMRKNRIIIDDQKEASQIHNKGCFGEPQSGGALVLDLVETAFLLETGKITLCGSLPQKDGARREKSSRASRDAAAGITLAEFVNYATKEDAAFEIKYFVYRDIRQRGYIIKSDSRFADFGVFERGDLPARSEPRYIVSAISERTGFDIREIVELIRVSNSEKKALLIAVVDEEGDLTYYSAEQVSPRAKRRDCAADCSSDSAIGQKRATPRLSGVFLKDRVIVWEEGGANTLQEAGSYGKPVGQGLQLSLIEAAHLLEDGPIKLALVDAKGAKRITPQEFKRRARAIQRDFDICVAVYSDLRRRALLPKTGFKYGSHFRVYDGNLDEQHAAYLVHAIPYDYASTWPEISRAVRLAHSVRKEMIFATVSDDKPKERVEYIKIGRVRP